MNRIHLLSEQVANQIAAGEVVERPASVVKELVENAIDAKATTIRIEIQAGGKALIQVSDDGIGMSQEDALLCLERHATSKINKAEDIQQILTMGFRGEALPSIASISNFKLSTKERETDNPEGTQVIVKGGKIENVKAWGGNYGTSIEVRELFWNIPARRKFLKSEETEAAHIEHYIIVVAMAHPEITFEFIKDTRLISKYQKITDTDNNIKTKQRLTMLYGTDQKWLKVETEQEIKTSKFDDTQTNKQNKLKVWGFISEPGVSRSTREEQHVFVNSRPIESQIINTAIREGYHTALEKGKYPICCLFLEINPEFIDINIHPAKREIKFQHEKIVRETIAYIIRDSISNNHTQSEIHNKSQQEQAQNNVKNTTTSNNSEQRQKETTDIHTKPPINNEIQQKKEPTKQPVTITQNTDFKLNKETKAIESIQEVKPVTQKNRFSDLTDKNIQIANPIIQNNTPYLIANTDNKKQKSANTQTNTPQNTETELSVLKQQFQDLKVIGNIKGSYIITESSKGILLIDQQAAQKRILFEKLIANLEAIDTAITQQLLIPETLELPPKDTNFIKENIHTLTQLGISLGEIGKNTFLLDAIPTFVENINARSFITQVIDELRSATETYKTLKLTEQTIIKTVCKQATKFNKQLNNNEAIKLIEQLSNCKMPYTCPQGKKTIIEISNNELSKRFNN